MKILYNVSQNFNLKIATDFIVKYKTLFINAYDNKVFSYPRNVLIRIETVKVNGIDKFPKNLFKIVSHSPAKSEW